MVNYFSTSLPDEIYEMVTVNKTTRQNIIIQNVTQTHGHCHVKSNKS